MSFKNFIEELNPKDRKNYEKYSKIRGTQQYRIIFETLKKADSNVTFKDVNSFVIFDKAIKDVLFKYLGVVEEYIKNQILLNFDFAPEVVIKNKEYHYFDRLPKCIRKSNPSDEITNFYKFFALNFGDLVSFLKEYGVKGYDIDKLKLIISLRNKVMHHSPLLFSFDFKSTANEAKQEITSLIDTLPNEYKEGCNKELRLSNNKTKDNISKSYFEFLLFQEEV